MCNGTKDTRPNKTTLNDENLSVYGPNRRFERTPKLPTIKLLSEARWLCVAVDSILKELQAAARLLCGQGWSQRRRARPRKGECVIRREDRSTLRSQNIEGPPFCQPAGQLRELLHPSCPWRCFPVVYVPHRLIQSRNLSIIDVRDLISGTKAELKKADDWTALVNFYESAKDLAAGMDRPMEPLKIERASRRGIKHRNMTEEQGEQLLLVQYVAYIHKKLLLCCVGWMDNKYNIVMIVSHMEKALTTATDFNESLVGCTITSTGTCSRPHALWFSQSVNLSRAMARGCFFCHLIKIFFVPPEQEVHRSVRLIVYR